MVLIPKTDSFPLCVQLMLKSDHIFSPFLEQNSSIKEVPNYLLGVYGKGKIYSFWKFFTSRVSVSETECFSQWLKIVLSLIHILGEFIKISESLMVALVQCI